MTGTKTTITSKDFIEAFKSLREHKIDEDRGRRSAAKVLCIIGETFAAARVLKHGLPKRIYCKHYSYLARQLAYVCSAPLIQHDILQENQIILDWGMGKSLMEMEDEAKYFPPTITTFRHGFIVNVPW